MRATPLLQLVHASEGGENRACCEGPTVWGWVRVWASDRGVTRVEWPRPCPVTSSSAAQDGTSQAVEIARRAWEEIAAYLRGERPQFSVPLDWSGYTHFQRRVWRACRSVGYGQTCTYGELAALVGNRRAARAVGQALARNPTPILVPCHRVLASGGGLGGFGGGLEMKRRLLLLEGAITRLPRGACGRD